MLCTAPAACPPSCWLSSLLLLLMSPVKKLVLFRGRLGDIRWCWFAAAVENAACDAAVAVSLYKVQTANDAANKCS